MTIFRDTTDKNHSDRSAGDRQRHAQKVRDSIKKNIADILSEESIITQDRDNIVRVPIRGVKEYRFIYGQNDGIGQGGDGDGEDGDGQPKPGESNRKAGDQAAIDYYDQDITVGELIDMMFEDIDLPDLMRRELKNIEVQTKVRKKGLRHKGPRNKLLSLPTQREHIRATQSNKRVMEQLKREIENLRSAGDFKKADEKEQKLREHEFQLESMRDKLKVEKKENWIPMRPENRRYAKSKIEPKKHSNAVVICIMDTSGSMDMENKYLARSFFFLLVSFVKIRYQNIEVVFIAHQTEAKEVTEDEFFHKGEFGGTYISSGYKKALEVIKERYDPSLWNAYAFHCSDGDNFETDNDEAVKTARELCKATNLFGYGEIKPQKSYYGSSMLKLFEKGVTDSNFQTVIIRGKEDVFPRFKEFFKKDRSKGES